jgi:hypothetical protein
MTKADALFELEGDLILPTTAAVGPWRPDSLHGGAVCALLVRSLERDDFILGRVTKGRGGVPVGSSGSRLSSGRTTA